MANEDRRMDATDGFDKKSDVSFSRVQFIPKPKGDEKNGEAKVDILNVDDSKKVGLSKEELMKYANDPCWNKIRLVAFMLFWVLWLATFVGAVIIILNAPPCPVEDHTNTTSVTSFPLITSSTLETS